MIDWEWAGVVPPKIGDKFNMHYDDGSLEGEIVTMLDSDGDETEDGELCYVAVVKRSDGFFENVDFTYFLENKSKPERPH